MSLGEASHAPPAEVHDIRGGVSALREGLCVGDEGLTPAERRVRVCDEAACAAKLKRGSAMSDKPRIRVEWHQTEEGWFCAGVATSSDTTRVLARVKAHVPIGTAIDLDTYLGIDRKKDIEELTAQLCEELIPVK